MRNKEFGYRVERSYASGRRYLRNPVHTQRSGVCAGECKDRETPCPMRLEDAISVTPYIHSGAEYVRGCEDRETHNPMRLEDAISVARTYSMCRGDARIERPMPPCVWETLSP